MLTPDGRVCPYYYADAHRKSRIRESCRLLESTADHARWTSDLCVRCPTPEITTANHCETMVLQARISLPGWRWWRRRGVIVSAICSKSNGPVIDPMVGCGQCHTPLTFVVAPDAPEPHE
jgi:hypothetical protein